MNIAFVPARSGSKRLPNKNIKRLNGKPLVYWTLKAFLDSRCFDKVYLSSDSQEYYQVISDFISDDRLVFHKRTTEQAGDSVKIFDYIKSSYHQFSSDDDLFAMGLPTAPLRSSEHVSQAYHLATSQSRPIFSACEYSFPISFAFTLSTNDQQNQDLSYSSWDAVFPADSPMVTGNTRSQDQLSCYHPNGAIYIIPKAGNLSKMNTFYDGALPFIMTASASVDIDNKTDFLHAESLMKLQQTG